MNTTNMNRGVRIYGIFDGSVFKIIGMSRECQAQDGASTKQEGG
jgi:hypothetical protein